MPCRFALSASRVWVCLLGPIAFLNLIGHPTRIQASNSTGTWTKVWNRIEIWNRNPTLASNPISTWNLIEVLISSSVLIRTSYSARDSPCFVASRSHRKV